jgi:hypothetical protein
LSIAEKNYTAGWTDANNIYEAVKHQLKNFIFVGILVGDLTHDLSWGYDGFEKCAGLLFWDFTE